MIDVFRTRFLSLVSTNWPSPFTHQDGCVDRAWLVSDVAQNLPISIIPFQPPLIVFNKDLRFIVLQFFPDRFRF
jgi:hypothetical protein